MISNAEIRKHVLQSFKLKPEQQFYSDVRTYVAQCTGTDFKNDNAKSCILAQVVWDLIIERIVALGTPTQNGKPEWPHLHLTEHGKAIIESGDPHFYDPEEYLHLCRIIVPGMDLAVTRYIHEAFRCFRASLLFASAVMLGAAAERAVIQLLEAIRDWETDGNEKKGIVRCLALRRYQPKFDLVCDALNRQIARKADPDVFHPGIKAHVDSFLEMVRVQRNDAVHSDGQDVTREQILLSIQTFPIALKALERMRRWYEDNTG